MAVRFTLEAINGRDTMMIKYTDDDADNAHDDDIYGNDDDVDDDDDVGGDVEIAEMYPSCCIGFQSFTIIHAETVPRWLCSS